MKVKDSPQGLFVNLSIMSMSIVFSSLIFAFLLLADYVGSKNPFRGFDLWLLNSISEFRTPLLTSFFLFITQLGKGVVIAGFACVFTFYLFRKRHYKFLVPLFVSLIGTAFTVSNTKVFIGRERPGEDIAYYLEQSLSFPSGHSALSMAFFGFMAYYLIHTKTLSKKVAIFLPVSLILLIGFSRMYLGVHYLSDVIGGYIVGMLWLLMGVVLSKFLK